MALNNEDEVNPSWLDAENDKTHKEEIAPLFGTGKLPLVDDEEQQKPVKYGAIPSNDDDEVDPSVITMDSGSSSKQATKKVAKIVITESGKPEIPNRHFMLVAFQFLESVGIISSLCLMASQVMPTILIPLDEIGAMSLILKVYVSLFCLLFIMVEWDLPIGFLRDAGFLQAYVSRGFLYSFLGLSCLEEAYSERVKEMVAHARDQFHVAWFSLFMQISAWAMLALGVVYMLIGLCCLKRLRDKLAQEYREKWEVYYEAMKVYKAGHP